MRKGFAARWASCALPMGAFALLFALLPIRAMEGFGLFPSDLGDGRLNAYFLENVYQFLVGGSDSLWTLDIFYPYPYTVGFSDNLFGMAPVYVVARAISRDSYWGFMIWWYASWGANYAASFFASRKFGLSTLGATVSAMVFTFSLPVTSMFPWPQFAYRFGAPLASVAWWSFIRDRRWPQLLVAAAWTVWQFYCGIYMGVFTLVVLVGILVGQVAAQALAGRVLAFGDGMRQWKTSVSKLGVRRIGVGTAVLASCAGLMVLLLWPYLMVTRLYGLTRTYDEIRPMVPTYRSYVMSDYSLVWSQLTQAVPHPPIAWEHQFFPGGALVILLVAASVVGIRGGCARAGSRLDPTLLTMGTALVFMFVISINVHGFSLWFYVSQLPLFSAIRAVARIAIVMLIPAGYLAGRGAEGLWSNRRGLGRLACSLLLGLFVLESVAVAPNSTAVSAWRQSDRAADRVPAHIPADSVLFIAQSPGKNWWNEEVTSMWTALKAGVPTLNGYSGSAPPGFNVMFGGQCAEMPARVLHYLAFTGKPADMAAYQAFMQRLVPVGFSSCQASWWSSPPRVSDIGEGPTGEQVSLLRASVGSRTPVVEATWTVVDVTVTNTGPSTVFAGGLRPVRLWHRYVDSSGKFLTEWVGSGTQLSYDLAPDDIGTVMLPLDTSYLKSGGRVEVLLTAGPLTVPSGAISPTLSIPVG